ncbi:hypothetical protein K525DRAFT_364894 [Schizophyllum commune Loenen D]|nr:hypothetical protein K525DRAFT_364894 [Schizophyllum commune Loenen D]
MKAIADSEYGPLAEYDIYVWQVIMTDIGVDFVLYGAQLALFIAAASILAHRQGQRRFTLVAILGLFFSSTIAVFANAAFYLVELPSALGASEHDVNGLLDRLEVLIAVARRSNYVMCDAVLVWRAWCLWQDHRLAKALLSACMCGSIGGSITECIWAFWPNSPSAHSFESVSQYLTMLIPLLFTNIVATSLIGIKVWYYRREIKGSLGVFKQRSQAEKVLMVLLESGLVYCLFWVCDCITFATARTNSFSISVPLGNAIHNIAGNTTQSLLSAQVWQAMEFADGPAATHDVGSGDEDIADGLSQELEQLATGNRGGFISTHDTRTSSGENGMEGARAIASTT